MREAILVQGSDWEGLYVNGVLVDEGHNLEQGEDRAIYFAKLSESHNFSLKKMKIHNLSIRDDVETEESGNLPALLTDLKDHENYME